MHKKSKELNNKSYLEATGEIPYNMTNDYIFRAVLQKNEKVLRGLVSSLLHLNPEEIQVEITNPIKLGSTIVNKDFLLDVDVILNHYTRLNLEMQVIDELNWPERSLSCLCRTLSERHCSRETNMSEYHLPFISAFLILHYFRYPLSFMLHICCTT